MGIITMRPTAMNSGPGSAPVRISLTIAVTAAGCIGFTGCSASLPSGCSAKTQSVVVQRDNWVLGPQDRFTYCNTSAEDATSYAVIKVPRPDISSFITRNTLSVEADAQDGVQPGIEASQGWSIAKLGYAANTPGVLSAADLGQQQRTVQVTIDERGSGSVLVYIYSAQGSSAVTD
ncbi:hypothetical protein GXW83_20760 [Streptacidiphilus sp. PB12-B1b]|uniref:hypothetical protein n=1 Tax=Streptacidiphilus sp. PB12-B1b TaxID=2705012 RepID=UPI0015F7B687|nr:hypothetical protein [Streptacidiphilus sp. PB12-B1b]QMU77762.1 hypothetical protein GXW83_20760 [Streptacidiphilus sp. PB12-B1b]